MAVPNNYIDKIKKDGDSRMISPAADMVRVDNDNFEGADLDEVLDEVAQAIGEAGEGGYAPPPGGIPKTDLAQSVQDSLDKADSALQDEDVAEVAKTGDYDDLQNKPTIPDTSDFATKTEIQQGLGTKQDTLVAGNGIVIGNDGKTVSVDAEVVQPVAADGTFAIRIGNNEYTINLNHTHENMAKLEKHTTATMPDVEDMESDTIYAEIEDGEVNVLYIGGVPFYGSGGGTSTPVLRQPADDSTIDVGKIASGESSVSKTITIKGKNLTQALTVAVTGTGYSVNKQSISAADANVGTTLTITCTNTDDNAAGTLSLASGEVSCDCDLVANIQTYEDLRGVKLTGSQWMQTDYKPNANTEFVMKVHYDANTKTADADNGKGCYILCCPADTANNKKFVLYNGAGGADNAACQLLFNNESSLNNQIINMSSYTSEFYANEVTISYVKGQSNGTIKFNGGTERTHTTALKTTTMPEAMAIGYHQGASLIYNVFDMTIFELTITENGNTVRHYVPKLRNGIPGLYDTVTDTFISSETSTELVAVN